jgi:uncharacterized protein YacL (UPF0231 family)
MSFISKRAYLFYIYKKKNKAYVFEKLMSFMHQYIFIINNEKIKNKLTYEWKHDILLDFSYWYQNKMGLRGKNDFLGWIFLILNK